MLPSGGKHRRFGWLAQRWASQLSVDPLGGNADMEMSFVPVFKTGRVYEWDAAKAILDQSGIPTFGQQHSVTGLVESMPSTPTPEPGVSFALLVPVARLHDAAELLRTAGFSVGTEPGVWHFNSNPRAQAWWRGLAILFLFAFALAFAAEVAGLLGR